MKVGTGGEPECGWRWEGGGIEVGDGVEGELLLGVDKEKE